MNAPKRTNALADQTTSADSQSSDHATTDEQPVGAVSIDKSQQAATPADGSLPSIPGYRVLHEIARGGMGRVLAAHDLTLDRDVAVKILLPGANAARFVRESKITARLPHPGIPPVHALGTLEDGSPFMAMKLIAGHTLAAEMKTADRARLLQVFTQLCQAVGFAHSRSVIHRDLKPNNVMVGAFGEVQVMDWGLAKDASLLEVPDEPRTIGAPTAVFLDTDATRSFNLAPFAESTDDQTRAGSVFGTPSYMAPEQARGEPADARTDVFALGGILCEMLTGYPTFRGQSAREVIQRAAADDLADAMARLDACDADAELVVLCRSCLGSAPADRPADGRSVAESVSAYLAGVQDRLHTFDREHAVAAAKVIEDRRRRKGLYIAASVIMFTLIAGVIGTTLAMFEARRQEANAKQGWGKAKSEYERMRALAMDMVTQINQFQSGQKDFRLAEFARRQALDKARDQFEQLRKEQPEDLEVQRGSAQLHRYSANISRFLSDFGAAETTYATSIQILEEMTERFPNDAPSRFGLAQALADRALNEMLMGRLNIAAATLDRAWTIILQTPSQQSALDYARTLGLVDHDRAKIAYLRGRFEDSLQFATNAVQQLDKLKGVKGDVNLSQAVDPLMMVWALNDLAIAQRELGQTAAAMASHNDALARMKKLDGAGATQDITYWVCEVREQRAKTARLTPVESKAAAMDLVDLSNVAQKLVEDHPQIPHYHQKLASVHLTRGELLTALSELEQAVDELTKSLSVSRTLLDRFGAQSASMLVRGQAYFALGRAQFLQGDKIGSQASWKNAAKVFEMALKYDADNFHHRRGLANAQKELKASAK